MNTQDHYMDIKEIAKEVRSNLKAAHPEWKFSVRIERFSMGQAMRVALVSGPVEALVGESAGREYAQLNQFYFTPPGERMNESPYWYSNGAYLSEEVATVLMDAVKIANRRNWDNSDPMTDYFDVNYYFSIDVGGWDKPYSVTG